MTPLPCGPSGRGSLAVRSILVGAFVAFVVLASCAVALAGAPGAARAPGSSGASPATSCPSSSGSNATVSIATNVTRGPAPLAVEFCGYVTMSYLSLEWTFGNGGNASTADVAHTFTSAGAYAVVLTVTFHGGNNSTSYQSSASVEIYVTGGSIHPLSINATPATYSGTAPLTVDVTTSVSGCQGPCTLNITYALGNSSNAIAPSSYQGTPVVTPVTLPTPGLWQITVNASDGLGEYGQVQFAVNVTGLTPLTVTAFAQPASGPAPLAVQFFANSTGSWPITFSWVFGDGGNGTGQAPTHAYDHAGSYTATVTAVDTLGARGSTQVGVNVTGGGGSGNGTGNGTGHGSNASLALTVNATLTRGTAPFNSTFFVSATGGTRPYSVYVCPGDGACAPSVQNWSGSLLAFSFTYGTPGNYTATATLTDSIGTQTIETIAIVVTQGSPLEVSVLESPLTGSAPLAVGFLAMVSGGTAPYSIEWKWGDGTVGSSANDQIVAHAYTIAGTYRATLVVTDASNLTRTVSLGVVNVSATNSTPATKPPGLLPGGGNDTVLFEYLGVAAAGAIVSGTALGVLLRRRRGRQAADRLVRQLEIDASHEAPPAPGREQS